MKDKKRLVIYSALALPFIGFGLFAATLDPMARRGMFQEFKQRTVEMFVGESEQGIAADTSSDAANGDGRGTANEEGARQGRGGGGRGGFDPAAMFERRDENADGKLTGEEISDRMRENLEAIDADKDGAVTLEEFQQGMQSMFANRGAGGGGRPGGGGFGGDPREGKPDRPQRPE